jgi:hypothetical protein
MKMKIIISLSLIGLMFACSPSTQLTRSWNDPSLTNGSFKPFTKILVLARLKDEASSRVAMDKICMQFKPGVAVPEYTYLTAADTSQTEVDAKLKKDGFDGLIIMKLTEVEESQNYHPATYYGGFYGSGYYGGGGFYGGGYYGGGYPGYYGTGAYVTEDKTFMVMTNIYSLISQKLVWSGTTSTLNPTSLNTSLDDIIAAIKSNMKANKIVGPNTK